MNISFQGIKNAGAQAHIQEKDEILNKGAMFEVTIPKGKHVNLHVELNNEGDNDLDDFREILKKYPNQYNAKTLNIDYDEFVNLDTGEKEKSYFLNGKDLEMTSENFKIFNKVFRLLEKIKVMPNEKLKVENSYIYSDEAKDSFCFYEPRCKNEDEFTRLIDSAHYPKNVRAGAKVLSQKFKNEMLEYIG